MPWDDQRVSRALRELRRRAAMTQEEAAAAASISPKVFRRIERHGTVGSSVSSLRAAFAPFDARVFVSVHWRGAELDRLLDAKHAQIVEAVIAPLVRRGWQAISEVSFSDYGERGSIDVFAYEKRHRACLVAEIKSDWGSLEETNRRLDVKARLAPKICLERFGDRPTSVSRLLVLPNETTVRRVAALHPATLVATYPVRGRAVRAWLHRPDHPISGIWFVSLRPTKAD
jgi:DNA-binding XRE family transcriptional regulator